MAIQTKSPTILTGPASLAVTFLALTFISACASSEKARETPPDSLAAVIVRDVPRTIPAARPPTRTTGVDLDTVRAGRFDQGKMWTFEHPPIEYFSETYDFNATREWFDRARLSALRIPGCSASFVSPNGLVLTNHHCGRDHATSVARGGESILDDGFYAASLDEERKVEGMWADQLVELRDVTEEVQAATAGAQTDAERVQARREAISAIEELIQNEKGEDFLVQIIPLYEGGIYSAYIFRRYTDVRLVFIPELQIGFFGGDPDNFTYPRYTLDMSLFRVYENGRPLETENYFSWTDEGVEEGDAVFAIGNPGSTFRLSSVAELEFRRDVEEPAILNLLNRRLEILQEYLAEADPETVDDLRNDIFSFQNAQKLYRGTVRALNDPIVFARRRDAQRQFEEAIRQDAELRRQSGDLFERMAAIQRQKLEFADEFRSFLSLNPQSSLGEATLRRALVAYNYLQQPEASRNRDQVLEQLASITDQPLEVQELYLAQRLEWFVDHFGADDPMVTRILNGRSTEDAAEAIIQGSRLNTAESAAEAIRSGTLTQNDPGVQLAAAITPRLRDYRSAFAALGAQEEEIASQLGRARFQVYGTDVPPDATFSLRIADGVVKGYPYNGTIAPPYTTFFGMYDLYYANGPNSPWDLPERWLSPPADFDRNTPLNFVSTSDIIGGNSGSAAVNTDLELVGLIFDGNIESLSGDFIYLTDRGRAISVDARGIREALEDIYEAERIVVELTTGRLVSSDQEVESN